MSRNQRLGVVAVTVLVAVVAFVALRPTDSDKSKKNAGTTTAADKSGKQPQAKPGPATFKIAVKNGQPVGGKKKIALQKGDQAEIDVTSNKASQVHLHGYDIEKDVKPGKATQFRFTANIEGVFDMEDHASDAKIASVAVSPK